MFPVPGEQRCPEAPTGPVIGRNCARNRRRGAGSPAAAASAPRPSRCDRPWRSFHPSPGSGPGLGRVREILARDGPPGAFLLEDTRRVDLVVEILRRGHRPIDLPFPGSDGQPRVPGHRGLGRSSARFVSVGSPRVAGPGPFGGALCAKPPTMRQTTRTRRRREPRWGSATGARPDCAFREASPEAGLVGVVVVAEGFALNRGWACYDSAPTRSCVRPATLEHPEGEFGRCTRS